MDLNSIWFWLFLVLLIIGYAIFGWIWFRRPVFYRYSGTMKKNGVFTSMLSAQYGTETKSGLLTGGGAFIRGISSRLCNSVQRLLSALILLLAALIFRAVSFEFRNKVDSPTWRRALDWAFGLGSLLPALLFGVGNWEYSSRSTNWCEWQLSRYILWSA